MAMVVRTNIMGINANRQLGMNNNQVSKSLEKLSSGYRINRAGDDAAGLAISEKMKAQIKGLETASMNCQDGISLVQTAEGALTEVHDMLNRMVELVGRAANGTMDSEDRSKIKLEMDELNTEIDRISESANFNNIKLFTSGGDNGSLVDGIKLQIDLDGGTPLTVQIDEMNSTVLGTNGLDVTATDYDANGGQDIQDIKTAINTVSETRSKLGAWQNRLEHTINNLDVTAENMSNANSRIRDTDMAKTMMNYTQTNVLTQSAMAMLAQANQQPQSVLQLLQ